MKYFLAACISLFLCYSSQAQTTDAVARVATSRIMKQPTAELTATDQVLREVAGVAGSDSRATSNLKRRHLTITISSLSRATQGVA